MADRLASALSAFDLLAITLSGGLVVAGAWWGVDGVPSEAPSAAALLGLIAASYVAGHLVGAIASLAWRRERNPDKHPWAIGLRPALERDPRRRAATEPSRSDDRLHEALSDIAQLPVLDQVELIRAVLRQRGFDTRFETMNTLAWVSRSLATASGIVALVLVGTCILDGGPHRLLPAAGGMAIAAALFELRTRGYQYSSARILKFEALALVAPPDALPDPPAVAPPLPRGA
jgi:hypothetical protein